MTGVTRMNTDDKNGRQTDFLVFLLFAAIGLMTSPIFAEAHPSSFDASIAPMIFCVVLASRRDHVRASFRVGFPDLIFWVGIAVTIFAAIISLAAVISNPLATEEFKSTEMMFYLCFIGTLSTTFLEN